MVDMQLLRDKLQKIQREYDKTILIFELLKSKNMDRQDRNQLLKTQILFMEDVDFCYEFLWNLIRENYDLVPIDANSEE